jgi:hypothetical protein
MARRWLVHGSLLRLKQRDPHSGEGNMQVVDHDGESVRAPAQRGSIYLSDYGPWSKPERSFAR